MVTLNDYSYVVFAILAETRVTTKSSIISILSEASSMIERFQVFDDDLDLQRIYTGEPPSGGAHKKKVAIFAPKSLPAKTVFIANLSDGWDTLLNNISRVFKSTLLKVAISDDKQQYPLNSIELKSGGNLLRLVRTMLNGDRWEFFQKGPTQDFEDVDLYSKRIVKDRLRVRL